MGVRRKTEKREGKYDSGGGTMCDIHQHYPMSPSLLSIPQATPLPHAHQAQMCEPCRNIEIKGRRRGGLGVGVVSPQGAGHSAHIPARSGPRPNINNMSGFVPVVKVRRHGPQVHGPTHPNPFSPPIPMSPIVSPSIFITTKQPSKKLKFVSLFSARTARGEGRKLCHLHSLFLPSPPFIPSKPFHKHHYICPSSTSSKPVSKT